MNEELNDDELIELFKPLRDYPPSSDEEIAIALEELQRELRNPVNRPIVVGSPRSDNNDQKGGQNVAVNYDFKIAAMGDPKKIDIE